MKHKQILDQLAARHHVGALDADLSRWIGLLMLGNRTSHANPEAEVVPPILSRWRCLLDADDAPTHTKNVVWVALATLLHRYGFRDEEVTAHALTAIDELNREVVLSDAFARQSPAIKELLRSDPQPLTRRPRQPARVTFLRRGDVVSIQHRGRFHGAVVVHLVGGTELPVIEFYAGTFATVPVLDQLTDRATLPGRDRTRYGVSGLTYLPDPANQVVTVGTREVPPLGSSDGWILSDIIRLQHNMVRLFGAG